MQCYGVLPPNLLTWWLQLSFLLLAATPGTGPAAGAGLPLIIPNMQMVTSTSMSNLVFLGASRLGIFVGRCS